MHSTHACIVRRLGGLCDGPARVIQTSRAHRRHQPLPSRFVRSRANMPMSSILSSGPQRSRDWDAEGASYGYCVSKHKVFFGYRLHLAVTLGGVILDFELTAANADERNVAADMLPEQEGRTFLGDKGYVQAQLAEELAACGVRLLAARRVN
jgi:hypothetical protein